MEQIPPERQYTLGEILAILEDTPITTPSYDSSSISSCSSVPDIPQRPSASPARVKRNYCTWCGRGGHTKNKCTDLTTAFKLGVVRTLRGKICLIDGGKIPWPHGEKCLKDWVLTNGRSENMGKYRLVGTSLRQEKTERLKEHQCSRAGVYLGQK